MENPEFSYGGYYNNNNNSHQFTPERRLSDAKNGDHFIVEELLDFPNDDGMITEGGGAFDAAMTGTSTDSSIATPVENSCNSGGGGMMENHFAGDVGGCQSFTDGGQFSGELCVPYDDLAELEWLSNFVEESFSTEDLQKMQLIQGMKARTGESSHTHQYHFQPETRNAPMLRPEMSVPAKARSKRSRASPSNWTSRLLVVAPPPATANVPSLSGSSDHSDIASSSGKKPVKVGPPKKKEGPDNAGTGEGRRCLHCATDKTPQWRTGPMGPKTLCNACGVRYKSGRLVPEYRPAASPTFVLTKHSNSHRKVMELRRQKEMMKAQQQQEFYHQNMMFDVANGDGYLIHQHVGPDFRQLI